MIFFRKFEIHHYTIWRNQKRQKIICKRGSDRGGKRTEIWNSWAILEHICGTFDLATFNVSLVSFGVFLIFPKIDFQKTTSSANRSRYFSNFSCIILSVALIIYICDFCFGNVENLNFKDFFFVIMGHNSRENFSTLFFLQIVAESFQTCPESPLPPNGPHQNFVGDFKIILRF